MMKLLGAACVMLAVIGYTGSLLEKQKRHRDALQALVSMAELLAGYIGYERLTMEEALARFSGGTNGVLSGVLARMADRLAAGADESFDAVWCETFCAEARNLFLREEELSIVLEMGKGLGGADVETQVRRLQGGARRLEGKRTDAARELAQKRRLYRYLGVAVGAMAVLVLI